MYSEQDPCECSVEQADIDLGQIQVEAASTQPFNFEGLQGTAKVVSFCVVFKKSAAEQCLAEVVSFWLPAS
jgi:hypothetical protein